MSTSEESRLESQGDMYSSKDMRAMPLQISFDSKDNDEADTRMKFFPSIPSPPVFEMTGAVYGATILAVLFLLAKFVGLVVLYHVFVASVRTQDFNDDVVYFSSFEVKGINLRDRLKLTSLHARQEGSLSSLSISNPVIITDESIEFLVSVPSAKINIVKESVSTIQSVRAPSPVAKVDPFAKNSLDSNLVVAHLKYDKLNKEPGYELILNKFNTISDHALLVTAEFEEQNTALSPRDLLAWYWCVHAVKAVGFYNSDYSAGASQSHKHMQLIPRDEIHALRLTAGSAAKLALPIEDIIIPYINTRKWMPFDPTQLGEQSDIYRLPQFDFTHGVAMLLNHEFWSQNTLHERAPDYGVYLEKVYASLLDAVGVLPPCAPAAGEVVGVAGPVGVGPVGAASSGDPMGLCSAYNVILTTSWMMVVPRGQREFGEDVGVNGFGYIGLLLGRNDKSVEKIREAGPLDVLKAVGRPTAT